MCCCCTRICRGVGTVVCCPCWLTIDTVKTIFKAGDAFVSFLEQSTIDIARFTGTATANLLLFAGSTAFSIVKYPFRADGNDLARATLLSTATALSSYTLSDAATALTKETPYPAVNAALLGMGLTGVPLVLVAMRTVGFICSKGIYQKTAEIAARAQRDFIVFEIASAIGFAAGMGEMYYNKLKQ